MERRETEGAWEVNAQLNTQVKPQQSGSWGDLTSRIRAGSFVKKASRDKTVKEEVVKVKPRRLASVDSVMGWVLNRGLNALEVVSNTVEGIGEIKFVYDHQQQGIFLEQEKCQGRECVGSLEYGKYDIHEDARGQDQEVRSALYSGSLSFMDDFLVVNGVPGFLMKTPQSTHVSDKFQEEDCVTCCRFSASSSWMIAGYKDGSVRVWNTKNGKIVQERVGIHSFPVCDVATLEDAGAYFLRFGKVVSIDLSGAYYIWDLASPGFSKFMGNFLPDQRHGDIILRKPYLAIEKTKIHAVITVGHYNDENESVRGLRALESMEIRVSAVADGKCKIHMAKLGTVPENFDITSCELSPSGTGVLLGYVPQTPLANHLGWSWVWEDFVTSPNEPPFQLMGGQGVWSRTKSYIATWDTMMNPDDATERLCHIRVWEYSPHRQLLKTLKDDGIPYWCCFVPNVHDKDTENLAACVVGDGAMFIKIYGLGVFLPIHSIRSPIGLNDIDWDLESRRVSSPFWGVGFIDHISAVATSTNRAAVGMSSKNGTGCIIDVVHGVKEMKLKPTEHVGCVTGIVVGTDTGSIAQFGQQGILAMAPYTRSNSGGDRAVELNLKFNEGGKNVECKFSGNGKVLGALQVGSGGMGLYDLEEGTRLDVQHFQEDVPEGTLRLWSFALSFDAKWLATLSQDKSISLWYLNSSRILEPERCPLIDDESEYSAHCAPKAFALHPSDDLKIMTFIVCNESGDLHWLIGEIDDTIPGRTAVNRFLKNISYKHKYSGKGYKWFKNYSTYREQGAGPCGCRFSADAKQGLLLRNESTFDIWDILNRSKLRTVKYQVPLSVANSGMDGKIVYSNLLWKDNELVGMNSFGPTHTGDFEQETFTKVLTVSEDGEWVLASTPSHPPGGKYKAAFSRNPLSDEKDSKLAFFHVKDKRKIHVLDVPKLAASHGFAVSLDGRRIACMIDNSTIRVWSPLAAKGLIPDIFLLDMNNKLDGKYISHLLDDHGYALFNMPDQTKMPLFVQVVSKLQAGVFDEMIDWIVRRSNPQHPDNDCTVENVEVSSSGVRFFSAFPGHPNILELAMEKHSPGMVKRIVDAMMRGVANTEQKAHILDSALERLGIEYKSILNDLMNDERLFVDVGRAWVPADTFKNPGQKIRVETHAHISKPIDAYERTFKKGKGILVAAKVRSLPLPNAAQLGFDGLIAKLLIANTPREVYGMAPVRHIIKFKWMLYARRLLINDLILYSVLIVFFSIYSFLTGKYIYTSKHEMLQDPGGQAALFFLAMSVFLGAICLYREIKQILAHKLQGRRGFRYWAFSAWNWVELLSYALLFCGIPFLHFSWPSSNNVSLTYSLALELILLWWKFLYFLQPFSVTGPVVIAIGSIIEDMVIFLLLASTVLFGFTSAFYLLFRHQRGMSHEELEQVYSITELEAYSHAFRSFEETLFTMFSYTFGTFDTSVLYRIHIDGRSTPNRYVGIVFFLVYMFLMAIIFLNLLIAIMADSYDRIITSRKVEFLKARARAIHDVETMMTNERQKKLKKIIQKYIHVIEPAESSATVGEEDKWSGQLQEIKKSFRTDLESELSKSTSSLQQSQQKILDRLKRLEER